MFSKRTRKRHLTLSCLALPHAIVRVLIPRSCSILLVEDNPSDAQIIQGAVADCGAACHLVVAETVEKAEQSLETVPFDLVLCDMHIPGGGSSELTRRIRGNQRLKSLPIIVLSSTVAPRPAYESGANAFVSKSLELEQFSAKIRALMHFWVDVAELPRSQV